jgi:endonuclease-3 related protein
VVNDLQQHVKKLAAHYGPQNWWPAESRLEVIIGAILTQNTSWSNVEKAIAQLRRERMLSVAALRDVSLPRLERLIRSSGYFRQKARRLKTFIRFLDRRYSGSLTRMFAQDTETLRAELLALNGIGPETADSILLYAGGHAIFVVDAYTRRILHRHGLLPAALQAKYDSIREHVESTCSAPLPLAAAHNPRHPRSGASRLRRSPLAQHYAELHAWMVRVGNEHCRSKPDCTMCPLRELLPASGPAPLPKPLARKKRAAK